ncbi:MAG: SH3 domain-containing protein [Oscillospiraceae bacterium]|nr:SH3 domain-containing protein [Oscillospiraceae bacterium]
MSTGYPTAHQYEPLRTPSGWSDEEKRLIVQLTEIFDDLYRRFGRLRFKDLGNALQTRMEDEAGNLAEVMLSTEGLSAAVNSNRLQFTAAGLEIRNAAGVTVFRQDNDTGNLMVSGNLAATGGTIGGFTIGADALYNGTTIVLSSNGFVRLGQLTVTDSTDGSNDSGPTISSAGAITLVADNLKALHIGEGLASFELPLYAQEGLYVNENLTTTNAPNAYIDPYSGKIYRSISGGSGGGGETVALSANFGVIQSTYTVGDTVYLSGSANGGTAPYNYYYQVSRNGGAWTDIPGTVANNTYVVPSAGTYQFRLTVQDEGNNADEAYRSMTANAPALNLVAGLYPNKTTVSVGELVIWTVDADGGSGNYAYQMTIFKDGVALYPNIQGAKFGAGLAEAGVYQSYVIVTDTQTQETTDATGAPVTVLAGAQMAYTTGSNVNMRAGAGTSYAVVTRIADSGSYVQITGNKSGEWYPVTWNGYNGWIIDDYLQLT